MLRAERGEEARVFGGAVAGRADQHHAVRARDRLGVEIDVAGVEIAEVDGLAGAVGVHRPEVVIVDLRAIDVFPAGVEDSPVGQHPGRVVLLEVRRELAEVAAVGVAAVEIGHLGQPAVDPAPAAGGNENDAAVGQEAGLDVVVDAGGQLPQSAAVGSDLVEVVRVLAASTIGEDDPPAVVIDARVADGPLRIVDQHGHLAAGEAQLAEPAALAVALLMSVGREIAEVGIPVLVEDAPHGEDNLLGATGRRGRN